MKFYLFLFLSLFSLHIYCDIEDLNEDLHLEELSHRSICQFIQIPKNKDTSGCVKAADLLHLETISHNCLIKNVF